MEVMVEVVMWCVGGGSEGRMFMAYLTIDVVPCGRRSGALYSVGIDIQLVVILRM